MKKFLLIMTAALAVSLTGCDSTPNYKAQGEKMAKELDRLCELKDTAAVLAFNDSIHAVEARIIAAGDTAAIAQFQQAIKESLDRNASYIAVIKMENGASKEDVVKDMASDAINGDIDIATITNAIDEMSKSSTE